MTRGGEAAHVDADFRDDDAGAEIADPRHGTQQSDGIAKRRDTSIHLLIDLVDGDIDGVNLLQMQGEQEAMMLGHSPAQGVAELLGRRLDPPMGEVGQPERVGLAGNHRFDHPPAAEADNVGNH